METRLHRYVLVCAFLTLISFCPTILCAAHAGQAELTGTITDETRAVIAGAHVALTDVETNQSFGASATDSGIYTFTNLKPGQYDLTVEAPGLFTFASTPQAIVTSRSVAVNSNRPFSARNRTLERIGNVVRVLTTF